MKEYVRGFCFLPDFSRVLLIQKNKPDWQAGFLNGLGGAILRGEYPDTAMRREFREECGLDVPEDMWFRFATLIGNDFSVACFWATDLASRLWRHETTTDEFVCFVNIERLGNMRPLPNLLWLIEMAKAHARGRGNTPILKIQYP